TLATCETPNPSVLRRAMVMGRVMASFTVEKFSLERLREIDRGLIRTRFSEFKQLTHFEDLGPLED
ncbi:MAG TPA: sugar kinase, partial [Myxococcaceae bacterium]|nr:sugar kinase [Myxococcaceae bacterium]